MLDAARTYTLDNKFGRDTLMVLDAETEVAGAYRAADRAEKESGLRADVLAVSQKEFDELMRDESGNDAKRIAAYGVTSGERIMPAGKTDPPNPPDITAEEFVYNMGRFGYSLYDTHGKVTARAPDIRAEYIISGIMLDRHTRRIGSGIPVVLCNAVINYGLLLYLARRYGFAGRLYGILLRLHKLGRAPDSERAISILDMCNVKPLMPSQQSITEALHVYGC